jgi:nucleoporin NDC1
VLVSTNFEDRRVTIYQELDRQGGSTWSQVFSLAIVQMTAVQDRIKAFKANNAKAAPAPQPQPTPAIVNDGISVKPKTESVLSPPRRPRNISGKAVTLANDFAKSQGSQQSSVVPVTKLLGAGATKVLGEANISSDAIQARAGSALDSILKLPIAAPFRQTFSRRIAYVVCGTPSSRASIIIDAVTALSTLATHSLKEDQPGQVQKSVGVLARTIAATICDIQDFIKTAPPHWTDINFTPRDRTAPEDVAAILTACKAGLEQILRSFGEYFGAIGVSSDEAKLWKNLAAKPKESVPRPSTPEMRNVR